MFPYPFTFYLPLFLHFKLFYMWVIHSWVTIFIYFIYFYLFYFLISVFRLFVFNINMCLYVIVAFYFLFYVCSLWSFFPLSKYLSVYFDYFVVYLYCFVYLTILTIFILFYLFMFLCLSVPCFAISLHRCCSCCSSLSRVLTQVSHEIAVIPLLEWSQKNFETHSCGCWHHGLLEGGPQSLIIWDFL